MKCCLVRDSGTEKIVGIDEETWFTILWGCKWATLRPPSLPPCGEILTLNTFCCGVLCIRFQQECGTPSHRNAASAWSHSPQASCMHRSGLEHASQSNLIPSKSLSHPLRRGTQNCDPSVRDLQMRRPSFFWIEIVKQFQSRIHGNFSFILPRVLIWRSNIETVFNVKARSGSLTLISSFILAWRNLTSKGSSWYFDRTLTDAFSVLWNKANEFPTSQAVEDYGQGFIVPTEHRDALEYAVTTASFLSRHIHESPFQ